MNGKQVYVNYIKRFTSGNLEGLHYAGFLSFGTREGAEAWINAVKDNPELQENGGLLTSGFYLEAWSIVPCRGVLVTYQGHVYKIENLEWEGLDPDTVERFSQLTDANSLSGADPIPDLAMAYRLKKFFPGIEVIFFTKPQFDPAVVY